jgi:hypothetical protein
MVGDQVITRYLEQQGCTLRDRIGGYEVWRGPNKTPIYYYVRGTEIYTGATFEKRQRIQISIAEMKKSLKWET